MCFQSVPFIYFDQCNHQQQSLHLQHVSDINMPIIYSSLCEISMNGLQPINHNCDDEFNGKRIDIFR